MKVPLKGRLAKVPLPIVFAKVTGENKSGVLSLADPETQKTKKRIGIKGGNQIYVMGGTINETLGRMLLKWGKITEKQYHESLAFQKEKNIKTGEALIMMNIVDGGGLAEALQKQTEEKILNCFAWPDAIYHFIEAEPPDDKKILFHKINSQKIVMEGIRRNYNRQRLEQILKPLARAKFRRTGIYQPMTEKMGLAPKESRVVQLFKDGMGFGEILKASNVDPTLILQVVFAMIAIGMIEPVTAKPTDSSGQSKATPPRAGQQQARAAANPGTAQSPAPQPQDAQTPAGDQEPPRFSIEGQDADAAAPQFSVEGGGTDEDRGGVQFAFEGEERSGVEDYIDISQQSKARRVVAENKSMDPDELKKRRKEILQDISKYEDMIKNDNFFTILGVERDADDKTVKKAFFRLAKKFHPDTNPIFFTGEFRDRAEWIFTRIGEAYNTLIDKKARAEYVYALDHNITQEDIDAANKALEAEGIFIKAEILFKKGDFRSAQTMIEDAVKLNPDEPEYHMYLGWCQYKSTQGAALGQARQTIQKALDMGLRDKVDVAHYYLGMLDKVEGRSIEEQRKHFAKAVEINPNNNLAASELRYIERHGDKKAADKAAADKKKGGLFGRFKK